MMNRFWPANWRRARAETKVTEVLNVTPQGRREPRKPQTLAQVRQFLSGWGEVETVSGSELHDAVKFPHDERLQFFEIPSHRDVEKDEIKSTLAGALEIGNHHCEQQMWYGIAPSQLAGWMQSMPGAAPHIVSFYTNNRPYRSHAARFQKSLSKIGDLNYSLTRIPPFQSWHEATAFKARFIRDTILELKRDILWIDIDASVRQVPGYPLFEVADFAIHRHHRWQFASGTVFFAYSKPALALIDRWIDYCEREPLNWDQLLLHKAHSAVADELGLVTAWLPQSFTKIDGVDWWDDACEHVSRIDHHQASRVVFHRRPRIAPQFSTEFKVGSSFSRTGSCHWPDVASTVRHNLEENYYFKVWEGVNLDYEALLEYVIGYYRKRNSAPFVLEVGAMDGVRFDPLNQWLTEYQLPGLLIEPLPEMFGLLKKTYRGCPNLSFANLAIDVEVGERTMNRISEAAVQQHDLESWAVGLSSFYDDRNALGGNFIDEETFTRIAPFIEQRTVATAPLHRVLADRGIGRVDILQIDTEGHDYQVLRTFPFDLCIPMIIHLEFYNLPRSEKIATLKLLEDKGYAYRIESKDLCATTLRINPSGNRSASARRSRRAA